MIHSNKHIIYFLAGCLSLFASCTDEEMINKEIEVEEGIPVTTTLSFGASNIVKVETKATDIDKDNKVNSLAILVFNKEKEKVGKTHFVTSLTDEKVTIATSSGKRYVYAVANYKSSLFDLERELTNIKSQDDLKNLSVKLSENNMSVLDDQFLMSGAFVGRKDDEEGLCIIGPDGQIKNLDSDNSTSGKIDLKRIMASVKFNVSCGNTEATFVADSWQVKNIPQRSNLIEQKSGDYAGGEGDYLASKLNSAFNIDGNTYSFSFLMMENRKQPKSTSVFEYDEREKMSDSPEKFSVANDHSTYVVLKGTYTGMTSEEVNGDVKEKNVKAFTTYYVHLGDWRSNLSDFNIFRNNRYTYNVSVKSVDKLIVEVIKDDEVWGGDGEIYLSTTNVRTFDAHYGTTVISFDKTMIKDLIYGTRTEPCSKEAFIENFKILASTPENNFSSNNTDINWVQYKRNTAGYNGFMKYKESISDEPLNADGFRSDLYDACIKDEGFSLDDSIRYTCFIDEYYYVGKPLREFINQQPRTIQIWTYYKKNEEPSSNSSVSMAAYTFSQYSICTIYDLDKLDADEKVNGWGTEWTQEGSNLPTVIEKNNNHNSFDLSSTYSNDLLQGRNNMIAQLSDLQSWETYVNFKNNEIQAQYKYAEYACLNRNRDLNGNGQLDKDEIRWYLPSINQYMGYSMGDNVLPEEVRLFTGNTYDRTYIYLSNTVVEKNKASGQGGGTSPDYDTQVFWACEGSSTGYYRAAVSELAGYGISLSEMPYRCIRNLRSVSEPVDDFVVPSEGTRAPSEPAVFNYLDFTYLNPRAIRAQVNQALTPYHKNTDEENRLPEGLEIAQLESGYDSGTWIIRSISSINAVDTNPCEDKNKGWRLPNQRELTIMTSHVARLNKGNVIKGEYDFEANSLACCTMAKYSDSNWRVYFTYVNDQLGSHNMLLGGPDKNHYYRCVRDKKITKNK